MASASGIGTRKKNATTETRRHRDRQKKQTSGECCAYTTAVLDLFEKRKDGNGVVPRRLMCMTTGKVRNSIGVVAGKNSCTFSVCPWCQKDLLSHYGPGK